jgi:hypothetical protein
MDYVPREWVGELNMIHDAHLFVLQIHTSSFGAGWQEEIFFFQVGHGVRMEYFHGLRVQDVAEFDFD